MEQPTAQAGNSATGASNGALSAEDVTRHFQSVLGSVVQATRTSNALPGLGTDYELYSSFPLFAELMSTEGDRILQLISRLYRSVGIRTNLAGTAEEMAERIVECNDVLLERIGNNVDEAAGIRKPEALVVKPSLDSVTIDTVWNRRHVYSSIGQGTDGITRFAQSLSAGGDKTPAMIQKLNAGPQGTGGNRRFRLLGSKNMPKPQFMFAKCIDNTNQPFVPRLRTKHHAHVPTKEARGLRLTVDGQALNADEERGDMGSHPHPYKRELDLFEPQPWQLKSQGTLVSPPKSLEETPLTLVDTLEDLERLVHVLNGVKMFAVDLEHHSYRTFLGLTCLMQISTDDADFIVDPLALWRSMHLLSEPFTDPTILKVFHGSDADMGWLQRDFGIYCVNMFDTGMAMRALQFPKLSLQHLIHHYVGITLEKEYQLSDWRIRPLPEELVKYARGDSHYLLYCFRRLTTELSDRSNEQLNLLHAVYNRSRDLCLIVYQKPLFNEEAYLQLVERHRKGFNSRQLCALKRLYEWRDKTARLEDESVQYVLPDHSLLQLAEVLPREAQGILALCTPVPPLVKQGLQQLHQIIYAARTQPLDASEIVMSSKVQVFPKREPVFMLTCPHDLSQNYESAEGKSSAPAVSGKLTKHRPALLMFEREEPLRCGPVKSPAITPFEQYLLAVERKKERLERLEAEKEATQDIQSPEPSTVDTSAPEVQGAPSTSAPTPEELAGDVISLRATQKKGKKRKAPKVVAIERSDVEPFDYAKASVEKAERLAEGQKSQKKIKRGGFKHDKRGKKFAQSKKNKSMSFGSQKHQQGLTNRSFPK